MSLKSSPGGQSFNFNTMGLPSASCSRSAFTEKEISCHFWQKMRTGAKIIQWHTLSINQTKQHMTVNRENSLGTHWKWPGSRPRSLAPSRQRWWHSSYSWPGLHPGLQTLYWRHRAATNDLSDVYLSLTPTQAGHRGEEIRQVAVLRSFDPCFMSSNLSCSAPRRFCRRSLRSQNTNCGSYLSLLPALSEDLPVVAVAGIL